MFKIRFGGVIFTGSQKRSQVEKNRYRFLLLKPSAFQLLNAIFQLMDAFQQIDNDADA
jgi:hypothetical protein